MSVYARRIAQSFVWAVFYLFVLGALEYLLTAAGFPDLRVAVVITSILAITGILVYGIIGVRCRTTQSEEFYVAGRRIPALFNGMATAADWMSAASFISLAGIVYLNGFSGAIYLLGWTGGFCLVALFLAPKLRLLGAYTIPDFFQMRYGSGPRVLAALFAIAISFVYLVAQIFGVGLIASRLTGIPFEIGLFLGLGGVLLCSFLGGMRAITWTQVGQCLVMITAYLLVICWVSWKQTGTWLPFLAYPQQLAKVTQLERRVQEDPKEMQVLDLAKTRVWQLEQKLADPKTALANQINEKNLMSFDGSDELSASYRHPYNEKAAVALWTAQLETYRKVAVGQTPFSAVPFQPLEPQKHALLSTEALSHITVGSLRPGNELPQFWALMICLMLGTASLPHILMRFYTTSSVAESRRSVTWALMFIVLLYSLIPILAVFFKFEILSKLVGVSFSHLPDWVMTWRAVDPSLFSISDINGDGIVQFNEVRIASDLVVLALSDVAGLPYVVSGLVIAGGIAAAMSTADGLLLTIANAVSHDLDFAVQQTGGIASRRVSFSKVLLVVIAMLAAYIATLLPTNIVSLVAISFSLAAASFFPAMMLGFYWKRATAQGALAGMLVGFGSTALYMVLTTQVTRHLLGLQGPGPLLWGIDAVSSGIFGVPLSLLACVGVSWATRPPSNEQMALMQRLSAPPQPGTPLP